MRRTEVVVFLARRDRSEVLVLRRAPELGGYWHTVAGGVEDTERVDQAAVRELMEEAGLRVTDLASARWIRFVYHVEPSDALDVRDVLRAPEMVVECVLVDVPFAYEPTLNWEHDGYRWCNVEDAVALFHWGNVGDALIALVGRPG
jgi:lipoyl(octanoyl) transferase